MFRMSTRFPKSIPTTQFPLHGLGNTALFSAFLKRSRNCDIPCRTSRHADAVDALTRLPSSSRRPRIAAALRVAAITAFSGEAAIPRDRATCDQPPLHALVIQLNCKFPRCLKCWAEMILLLQPQGNGFQQTGKNAFHNRAVADVRMPGADSKWAYPSLSPPG